MCASLSPIPLYSLLVLETVLQTTSSSITELRGLLEFRYLAL